MRNEVEIPLNSRCKSMDLFRISNVQFRIFCCIYSQLGLLTPAPLYAREGNPARKANVI